MTPLRLSPFDQLIAAADRALRTLAADPQASRANPAGAVPAHAAAAPLSEPERREAAALMRVNHVGEVCAQAMYDAQALAASSPALRETFVRAAQEEADHLAWTQQRIGELGGRTSLLNPSVVLGGVCDWLGCRAAGRSGEPWLHGRDRAPG